MAQYDGIQTFSATTLRGRAELGERVTAWIKAARVEVIDRQVLQSSGDAYHCITIVLFWRLAR